MTDKRVNIALIAISLFTAVFIYWPTFSGLPLWDDKYFWFIDPVMKDDFSYLSIWQDFNWPLSVSCQKLLYSWWGTNYIPYHVLNFTLHLGNSFLLLALFRMYKLPLASLAFAFFLLQPANMISVAWMIQFKTLLCMLFALLAFIFFKKSEEKSKCILLTYCFYLLSLLSKSASIPLGIIFFLIGTTKSKGIRILIFLPFLVLSLYSTFRLIHSPITEGAIEKIKTREMTKPSLPAPSPQTDLKIQMPNQNPIPKEVPPAVNIDIKPKSDLSSSSRILPSLYYYFWQAIIPIKTHPIHSPQVPSNNLNEYIHLVFIFLLIFLNWKSKIAWPLIFGHLMLIPYVGLIYAPFMNVTWVSDQHLYLVIPFFLAFWLLLVDKTKIKDTYKFIFFFIILALFVSRLGPSASFYKDEISFFKSSLHEEQLNVPISYNLAVAYSMEGNNLKAIETLSQIIRLSQDHPELKGNEYFPAVIQLFFQLQELDK